MDRYSKIQDHIDEVTQALLVSLSCVIVLVRRPASRASTSSFSEFRDSKSAKPTDTNESIILPKLNTTSDQLDKHKKEKKDYKRRQSSTKKGDSQNRHEKTAPKATSHHMVWHFPPRQSEATPVEQVQSSNSRPPSRNNRSSLTGTAKTVAVVKS